MATVQDFREGFRDGLPTYGSLGVPTFCLQFSANLISLCLEYFLSKNRPIFGIFLVRLNMLTPINSQISEWHREITSRDNCAETPDGPVLSDSLPY